MKILHILRSEPDETIKKIAQNITNGDESKVAELYKSDFDWSSLVDDIFTHEKVISWW
jgi:hypothetical protein